MLLVILVFSQCTSIVSALSPDQLKVFQSGINYFDVTTCDTSGGGGDAGTPSVSGQTTDPPAAVQKVVWDTLTGGGIDPIHTAAVMGNIAHEGAWDPENSSENPDAPNRSKDPTVTGPNYGYGLIGWTPGQSLLDQMKQANINGPPYTAETQAAVILAEIQGKTTTYAASLGQQFLNTKTIKDATDFYEGPGGFENPLNPDESRKQREDSATQFLAEFSGETGSPTATPSAAASCCPASSDTASLGPGSLPSYIKAPYNAAFTAAGKKFNVDPAYLVGIFYDENYGYQNAVTAFNNHELPEPPPPYGNGPQWPSDGGAGAEGPFQFLPSTWGEYGYDGNGDGKKDVNDIIDAAFGAAHLLAADGGSGTLTLSKVIRSANAYSGGYPEYPQAAWTIVQAIHADAGDSPVTPPTAASPVSDPASADACSGGSVSAQQGTVDAAVQAAKLLSSYKVGYVWGGLHGAGQLDITDASKLQQLGADCSGSVSWVLHQAGMLGSTGGDSTALMSWGQAGQGQEMTVWNIPGASGHSFIEFNIPGLGHYELNTAYGIANGIDSGKPSTWPNNTPGATGPGPQFFKWGSSGWDTTSGFTPRHWPGT